MFLRKIIHSIVQHRNCFLEGLSIVEIRELALVATQPNFVDVHTQPKHQIRGKTNQQRDANSFPRSTVSRAQLSMDEVCATLSDCLFEDSKTNH